LETDETRRAVNLEEEMIKDTDETAQEAVIVIPIKLREQVIGTLKVKAPEQDRSWSKDEINLAKVISERLSLAIDNARLIQESQNRAAKEQIISEVTARISSSINLQNILQTAVEELGNAMPGSEVVIKLQNDSSNNSGKLEI
jgi:GAF domain-containing protein